MVVTGAVVRSLTLAAALLVGIGTVSTSDAGEVKPATVEVKPAPVRSEAELKLRMKSLITEALKAGDLWTALQAEAYASQKLRVRSGSILGTAEIIGDPLFAFPNRIVSHHLRGDKVIVVAGRRIYQLAPDGRPLVVSQPIPFTPIATAASPDGTFVALADRQRYPSPTLKVVVRNILTGLDLFTEPYAINEYEYINGDIQVAPDGSAVMVGLRYDSNGTTTLRSVVVRAGGSSPLSALYRPVAVAAGGVWAIGEPTSNSDDKDRQWALRHDGATVLCQGVAAGPGIAAVITSEQRDQVHIVGADGRRRPLPLPRPLTRGAQVLSTGEWLVVASGWQDAGVSTEVDLLGNPVEVAREATSTWFYRWGGLRAGAVSPQPDLAVAGVPAISTLNSNTVFVGYETTVNVVDLSEERPQAKPLMNTAANVRYMEARHGRLVLWLRDDKFQIIDEGGVELWNGVANKGVQVHDPWFASISQGHGKLNWLRLSASAAERTSVSLSVAFNSPEWQLDRYHRRLVAYNSRTEWVEFDPLTGKQTRIAGARPGYPQVAYWGSPTAISPFSVQFARLVPRLAPPMVEDPSSRWNPLDAWRVNGALMVLDHHGQVHLAGRKRGTYQTIGSVDHPHLFAQTSTGELMIAGDEDIGRARLAPGPILATEGQGIGQPAQSLPEGQWRVKRIFFVPPRGGSMMWDASRCGFVPQRLRSPPPPATGLLVITDSLVFDLDPTVAKQLGVIDKAGLRDKD